MPTAKPGPWLDAALERGLIAKGLFPVRAPAPVVSERQFQDRVLGLARANGWHVYHTFDSRRSAAGFPDLVLVRGPVLFLAELKVGTNAPTAAQWRWLRLLAAVPGVRVRLWRPEHWPAIEVELTAPGGAA